MPGSLNPSSPDEAAHAHRQWVEAEAAPGPAQSQATSEPPGSFTRVTIGHIKPAILKQMAEEVKRPHTARTLAHLYHFYLHGERGNRRPGSGSESEGGSKTATSRTKAAQAPQVRLQYTTWVLGATTLYGQRACRAAAAGWGCNLAPGMRMGDWHARGQLEAVACWVCMQ